jgi:hypothetical protein
LGFLKKRTQDARLTIMHAPGPRSRKFVKQLFEKYADAMRAIGSTSEAERFQQIAASL